METVICGSDAYCYWRTPPIVHLLAAGPEDHPALRGIIDPDSLAALRVELSERLPLSRLCSETGPAWRNPSADALRIREVHPLLATWANPPVEVLAHAQGYHASKVVRPRYWASNLPFGSTTQLVDDVYVTTPTFTMLQLATHASLVRTVLLASELCGSFAVYRCPAPIARVLEPLIDRGSLPRFGGWSPCTKNGRLTDLWSREPLTTPSELRDLAERSDSRNGRARLIKASELVVPCAASPFEVQAGVLLGFSRRLGGEGFAGFTHNEKVALSKDARLLAQRDYCLCDLYWPDGLDLECQGAGFHDDEASFLSDSDRTTALRLMGIDVLPVTYEQISNPRRFEALTCVIAKAKGLAAPKKTQRDLEAAHRLREEVFVDWASLPFV